MNFRFAASAAPIFALAACGGSSESDVDRFLSLSDLVAIEYAIENGGAEPVAASDLPNSASLNGLASVSISETDSASTVMVGNASVDYAFASGTMSGSADTFEVYYVGDGYNGFELADDYSKLDGKLTIDGTISGATYASSMSGLLAGTTTSTGSTQNALVNVDLASSNGKFVEFEGDLVGYNTYSGIVTLGRGQQIYVDVDAGGGLIVTE